MKVLYERVAGIDVHKDMIKIAIRSPGDKAWTRKTEILTFRTFYGVLQEMARELRRRGVTHVVMEASGVYNRAGVLRPVRAGLHRGRGDQPGARQGAEGAQDRREGLRSAGGVVRMRAAARVLYPGPHPNVFSARQISVVPDPRQRAGQGSLPRAQREPSSRVSVDTLIGPILVPLASPG
jgi:hypothetical protein